MNNDDLLPIHWARTPKMKAKMNSQGIYMGSPSGYGWMDKSPESLKCSLENAVERFKDTIPKMPDAIAFTGSSGAAIAFPLALRWKLPLIMVRKPHEKSHGVSVECNSSDPIRNFMIVDDFVQSGATVRRILAGIARRARHGGDRPPPCIGIYQWCEGYECDRTYGRQIIPLYVPKTHGDTE